MKNVGKSLATNALSSILASSEYPIGILLPRTVPDIVSANHREHDTGETKTDGVRYDDEGAGLADWCRIIAAITSQLNSETVAMGAHARPDFGYSQ